MENLDYRRNCSSHSRVYHKIRHSFLSICQAGNLSHQDFLWYKGFFNPSGYKCQKTSGIAAKQHNTVSYYRCWTQWFAYYQTVLRRFKTGTLNFQSFLLLYLLKNKKNPVSKNTICNWKVLA